MRTDHLPSAQELRLLHAGLDEPDSAMRSWRDWLAAGGDIETHDYRSFRLFGLVHRNLADRLDPSHEGRLRGVYRRNWYAGNLAAHAIAPAVRQLADADIRVMPIKGAAVAATLRDGLGIRWTEDIDLLVPPRDRRRAIDALVDAGFAHRDDRRTLDDCLDHLHGVSLERDDGVEVDVHWRPVHGPGGYAELWDDAREGELGGAPVLLPSIPDLILHACVHAMSVNPMGVGWFADVVLVTREYPDELDWDGLVARSAALRTSVAVEAALARIAREFRVPPDAVLSGLRAAPKLRGERVFHRLVTGSPLPWLDVYAHHYDVHRREARLRGARVRPREYADYMAVVTGVPPRELPGHLIKRAAQELAGVRRRG